MPDRPLLVFSEYGEVERNTLSPGFGSISTPSHSSQIDRLEPKFEALQRVMEARLAEFQLTSGGIEPEEVLVIEVAGSVNEFLSVCNNTDGLEWMADVEADDLEEGDFFYSGDEPSEGKSMNGRLLLSMTNQEGIENLLSMWENWKEDENYDYPYGLNGWKNIFSKVIDIRKWGIKERFEETGVREDWEFELGHGRDRINFELELWFRNSEEIRERVEKKIEELVNDLEGDVIKAIEIPEIRYHGILVDMPSQSISNLLENQNVELVKCDQIMFFRPTGQSTPKIEEDQEYRGRVDFEVQARDVDEPEIALLDGLPIQNHQLLRDHLIVDDPDEFDDGYPFSKREHGTSMSSIIINGDLNDATKLSKGIYVRPILKYDSSLDVEKVPDDRLLIDLVYDAVIRMFEGDDPPAPNVKVINISIGDPYRPFFNELSSVARLLDWLSYKYNVLFIVSAGNNNRDLIIDTDGNNFEDLAEGVIQEKVLAALYRDRRNRRLISPAESINSLTVGASHDDNSSFQLSRFQRDLIKNPYLPSPINPIGSGFKRAVKPEVIMPGGKIIYRLHDEGEDSCEFVSSSFISREPGIKVAYSGSGQGDLDAIAYTSGTSNATAMTTNFAGHIIDVLNELNEESERGMPGEFYPVLIKTLIGHTSSWGEIEDYLRDVFDGVIPPRKIKDGISKIMGFGNLALDRAYECDVNRASILGYGSLTRDTGHVYEIPIPPVLSGEITPKRLIVTLGWFSPINPGRQNYRKAHLYFDPPMDKLDLDRDETYAYTAKRGTLQHEILVGERAVPIVEGEKLNLQVNCRQDAGILNESVRYGLCVTLEVTEQLEMPIYEQVKERIPVPVEVRT